VFFSQRSTQAEYFDSVRPEPELRAFYNSLNQVNRLFDFAHPFKTVVPRLFGDGAVQQLEILDLGAGDGLLGQLLQEWARTHGWNWRFTNLDVNPVVLGLNGTGRNIAGSALSLPFVDGAFDLVIASQVTHHFDDSEAEQHLREAWRVARRALLISDLHRSPLLYVALKLLLITRSFPRHFGLDGLLSVKRGWRARELKQIALKAGVSDPKVASYFHARILLEASRAS